MENQEGLVGRKSITDSSEVDVLTLYMIKLQRNQSCDWCEEMILAEEMAFYNPYTKKVYHEGECAEGAEGI